MAKTVVIDMLLVTVRVPADLPDRKASAVRRTLAGSVYTARVRRAVAEAVRAYPELTACRVSVSR